MKQPSVRYYPTKAINIRCKVSDYPSPNSLQLITCYEYHAMARH